MKANSLTISYYQNLLLSMKLAKYHGLANIAKPVLMLAIMEGIVEGSISGNIIEYNQRLIDNYTRIYQKYRKGTNVTLPIYPYYYLNSEEFYHIKGDTSRETPSEKFVREKIEYAFLDDVLWDLLTDKETNILLSDSIIRHYF